MPDGIGGGLDVYSLESNKLHNHMMVFERMIMMTVCPNATCVDFLLNMKSEASNW